MLYCKSTTKFPELGVISSLGVSMIVTQAKRVLLEETSETDHWTTTYDGPHEADISKSDGYQ